MTANPRIHRFDFNALRDFRGPISVAAVNEPIDIAPPPPPAPVFSEADLESARLAGRKQGYNEGFAAGRQDAQKEVDQKTENANLAVAQFAELVSGLQASYKHMLVSESAHLSQLITSIARKVAGEAIEVRGVETIAAIVERCLPVIFSKPRVIIELNPEILETAIARIEGQLRNEGFEGEIQFRSNEDLGISDLVVDWGAGQVNRSESALWNEINTLIERIPLEITFAETLGTTTKTTGE